MEFEVFRKYYYAAGRESVFTRITFDPEHEAETEAQLLRLATRSAARHVRIDKQGDNEVLPHSFVVHNTVGKLEVAREFAAAERSTLEDNYRSKHWVDVKARDELL